MKSAAIVSKPEKPEPKSPNAATGLYRHGTYLWDQGKKAEARIALNRVLSEYPSSDEVSLVKSFLRDRDR